MTLPAMSPGSENLLDESVSVEPSEGPTGTTAGPHIGIGRAHKHSPVILLIDDLDIRVIATNTGELLRALALDPERGYQPRFKKQ